MKEVIVLRHAPRDMDSGELTPEGREIAEKAKDKIGKINIVIASPIKRTQDTAILLTGVEPVVDDRAGLLTLPEEQEQRLDVLAKNHPLGYGGAIFENAEFRHAAEKKGEELVQLIKETLEQPPVDGRALIVTHDGTIIAAEKVLTGEPFGSLSKSYKPLEGFRVNSELQIENL